jgi:hypothetical protein
MAIVEYKLVREVSQKQEASVLLELPDYIANDMPARGAAIAAYLREMNNGGIVWEDVDAPRATAPSWTIARRPGEAAVWQTDK